MPLSDVLGARGAAVGVGLDLQYVRFAEACEERGPALEYIAFHAFHVPARRKVPSVDLSPLG